MAEIMLECRLCQKGFRAERCTARYCLDCRYSRQRYALSSFRRDPSKSSEAFMQLAKQRLSSLNEKELQLLKHYILETETSINRKV